MWDLTKCQQSLQFLNEISALEKKVCFIYTFTMIILLALN